MRWLWRHRSAEVAVSVEDDRASRQLRELAVRWQAEERQAAARRALTEPTQPLAVEPPLMTLAAEWRANGGGAR